MNVVGGTTRMVTGAGEAATATLGAVGGAAVGVLVGSMKGAAVGAAEGARRGSHSTPAAVVTLGAVAVTGVVQWPIVAAVGGTALVLEQLKPRTKPDTPGTGTPATPDAGAKPAALSVPPTGALTVAKTPAPARKSPTRRRTPAKTPPSSTP
ncbi:hypothetical protein ACWEK5_42300 [Rhodococcus koreensis]